MFGPKYKKKSRLPSLLENNNLCIGAIAAGFTYHEIIFVGNQAVKPVTILLFEQMPDVDSVIFPEFNGSSIWEGVFQIGKRTFEGMESGDFFHILNTQGTEFRCQLFFQLAGSVKSFTAIFTAFIIGAHRYHAGTFKRTPVCFHTSATAVFQPASVAVQSA